MSTHLKNNDINKVILENIDIEKGILENIDIDIDMGISENIDIDINIDRDILSDNTPLRSQNQQIPDGLSIQNHQ